MLCNPSVHINKKVIFLVPYFDEANIVNTDVIFSTTPVQEFGFKVLEKTKCKTYHCCYRNNEYGSKLLNQVCKTYLLGSDVSTRICLSPKSGVWSSPLPSL